jgi:tRNA threonylcarbamoyladenosine biosynthesis protein TsaE
MQRMKNQTLLNVRNLAVRMAKKYVKKDTVIGLVGELGAGKTVFVKSFAGYLGIKKIKSPTFVVGNRYRIGKRQLYHFDFYRLSHLKQLQTLEIDEILKSNNRIVLIEWVDKFPHISKLCDVQIELSISGKNLRNVTIH